MTSILNNYCALIELWEQSLETRLDPDVKERIIGVKSQMMKFPSLFGLLLCDRILNITDNLSKTLQSQSMSAVETQHIAELTVKTLQGMRTDDMYKTFLDFATKTSTDLGVAEPVLPRPRKVSRRLDDGASQCYQSSSVQEHYSRLYYEAMDLAKTSIKDRFDQPGFHMYRNLETVLVNAANKKEYIEELKEILAFYSDDFNEAELRTQLQIFGESFKVVNSDERDQYSLQQVLAHLRSLTIGERMFFGQLCRVAHLILVMPATNAVSERSFSTLRRVKSYLRSTMNQQRLNHLMIASIYKESLDVMDLTSIANDFVSGNEHIDYVYLVNSDIVL